jgi:hypothetical protein
MNSYESLDQLKSAFVAGKVPFPDSIMVGGLEYRLRGSSEFSFDEMVIKGYNGIIIYSCGLHHRDEALAVGLDVWLLFVWSFDQNKVMQPTDVRPTTQQRSQSTMREDITEANKPSQDNLIGDKVTVKFTTLPGTNPLKGKVDTGAEISSLHVDNWAINGNKVQFVSSALSPNTITMTLHDHQAVKSVNGIQYRPVVELNVRINDRLISGVLFNLTDRSSMEYPVLIGQNALERGKFLIDPSIREDEELEEIDWALLHEEVADVVPAPTNEYNPEKIQEVYNILKDNNISFNDLIRHIKTEVASSYETIKY